MPDWTYPGMRGRLPREPPETQLATHDGGGVVVDAFAVPDALAKPSVPRRDILHRMRAKIMVHLRRSERPLAASEIAGMMVEPSAGIRALLQAMAEEGTLEAEQREEPRDIKLGKRNGKINVIRMYYRIK